MLGSAVKTAKESSLIQFTSHIHTHKNENIKSLYFEFLNNKETTLTSTFSFLKKQLNAVDLSTCDLPANIEDIQQWIDTENEKIGKEYHNYLEARKNGAQRRYFSGKSHALYFLKSVAPTKLVDGSWLYGLLNYWNDERFSTLIKIYLEELGNGITSKNHVLLYKKLLRTHGCEQWENLSDNHYLQGTIQLALAHQAQNFLPELIGYNLGYEQLALHLLITAYELNELGIDPYYFTLHVTVDNAVTGHAKTSLEGLRAAFPKVTDADKFYQRVRNGYALNFLGENTLSVINSFDLQHEVEKIFIEMSKVGKYAHSNYCRINGRSINEWLSTPDLIPLLLISLQEKGWIKRHQDPKNSRFWKLIEGEKAEMFGVFNSYQKQVIYEWIAGDSLTSFTFEDTAGQIQSSKHLFSYRAYQHSLNRLTSSSPNQRTADTLPREILRKEKHRTHYQNEWNDFNQDLRDLEENLFEYNTKEDVINYLKTFMSPLLHHTPVGLIATRIFTQLFLRADIG